MRGQASGLWSRNEFEEQEEGEENNEKSAVLKDKGHIDDVDNLSTSLCRCFSL